MGPTVTGPITLSYTDSVRFEQDLAELTARVDGITVSNLSSDANNLTISVTLNNYSAT